MRFLVGALVGMLLAAPVRADHDMSQMDHSRSGKGYRGGGGGGDIDWGGAEKPPKEYLSESELDELAKERGHHAGDEQELLPYSPKQQGWIDKSFGANSYQSTHDLAHKNLNAYREQAEKEGRDPATVKKDLGNIVGGVREILNAGLIYHRMTQNERDNNSPEDQRMLAMARNKINEAETRLETVKMGQLDFHNIIMGGDGKNSGVEKIMDKLLGDQHLDHTINSSPVPNTNLITVKGNNQLRNGDAKGAQATFEQALSLDPGNVNALTGRAASFMDQKDFAAARADAQKALEIDPKDSAAQAILALAHDAAGKGYDPKAQNNWANRDMNGPAGGFGSGPARSGLSASAFANGSALQASAYTRGAARLIGMGDYQEAAKQSARAAELDPRSADAFALLALSEARLGHHEAALKAADAALALDPNSTTAHNAKLRALNGLGRYTEALGASDAALKSDPRNAYAYYMRSMAYNGMHDRKHMLEALAQAAALDGRYQSALDLARSSSDEKDLSFLFPEENLAAAKALLAEKGSGRGWADSVMSLGWPSLIGLALIVFGMLHFAFGGLTGKVVADLTRTGPSVGRGETTLIGMPTPPPLTGGHPTLGGTILRGQYRRLGQIGSSVYGAVYEGTDLSLDRRVAIRKLRAEMRAEDRERVLAPARKAAQLNHPGIVSMYAVLDEPDALYLVCEYAGGKTLRDLLASRGPLPAEEAVPLFRKAAAALDYAHARGVVHGALKASNVMVSAEGAPKLLDFGLARGPADIHTDLDAFAATLRETIAGLSPLHLDAVDAALAKSRGQWLTAAGIVDAVSAALDSVKTA